MRRQKRTRKVLKMEIEKKSGTDRLSDLPDHLLLHILQCLMTKYAVQTCVLSQRWKNLWKRLTNIKLHHFDLYNGDVFDDKIVSQFLSGRDNSVPIHSISYVNACMDYAIPPKTNVLIEIMEYAASHNVQQLYINTQADHMSNLELPLSIFNCRFLTSLSLCLWDVTKLNTKMFPKSLNLPALKTLRLVHLTFFTGDNGYAEPFSTCKMLSTLIIFNCYLQDDAQGLCISNSKVSSLTMAMFLTDSPNTCKVMFCTPKLTSLTFNWSNPTFPAPLSSNLTLLEELNFDYCPVFNLLKEDILISWLRLLAEVKTATLNFHILDSMVNVLKNNGSKRTQLPCFVKLKTLKMLCPSPKISDERLREMVTCLLQNSPPNTLDIIRFDIIRNADKHFNKCLFSGIVLIQRVWVNQVVPTDLSGRPYK